MSPLLAQSLVFAVLGVGLMAVTVRLARRGYLAMRFLVAFAAVALAVAVAGPLVTIAAPIADRIGVTPTGLLLGVSAAITLAITLQLSVAWSRQRTELIRAVEDIGRLRLTVERHLSERSTPRAPSGAPLVVVPAFNEAATVGGVVSSLVGLGLEVLVVDDGSVDATAAMARASGADVLRLSTNVGVGGAVRAGVRYAVDCGYAAVLQCDADGQHPAGAVRAVLVASATSDAHLLVGSRFVHGGSFEASRGWPRRVAMSLLARSTSSTCGLAVRDATSGLRVIREPLLSACGTRMPVEYLGDTVEFLRAACRAGYSVREVPVTMVARAGGTPSANTLRSVGFLVRVCLSLLLGMRQRFPPCAGAPATVLLPPGLRSGAVELGDLGVRPSDREQVEQSTQQARRASEP